MQRHHMQRHRSRHLLQFATLSLVLLLATACGPLADDDEDPTATAESVEQPAGGPADTETDDGSTRGTPPPYMPPALDPTDGVSTPDGASPPEFTGPASTPSGTDAATDGTPVTISEEATGTPASAETGTAGDDDGADQGAGSGTSFSGSDGTSGATPEPSEPPPAATPEGPFFVREVATPAATPGSFDGLEPALASSCEPEVVPVFTNDEVEYVTNTDVNFRAGPGADCDRIGDGPVPAGASVLVVGGPVVREGDDEFVWVQVEIAEETGWIITEALEPAP